MFPPVFLGKQSNTGFRKWSNKLDEFSNTAGEFFVYTTLVQKIESGGLNSIILDRNILVDLGNGLQAPIGEELLMPSEECGNFVVTPVNLNEVEVSLRSPPSNDIPSSRPLPMDSDDHLDLYQDYMTDATGDGKYLPHRWPKDQRSGTNSFRNPHTFPVNQLEYLTGVSVGMKESNSTLLKSLSTLPKLHCRIFLETLPKD